MSFVHKGQSRLDVTADDMITLHDAGVSRNVIKAILDESDARGERRDGDRGRDYGYSYSTPRFAYGYYGVPYFYDPWYYNPWYYGYGWGPRVSVGFNFGFGRYWGGHRGGFRHRHRGVYGGPRPCRRCEERRHGRRTPHSDPRHPDHFLERGHPLGQLAQRGLPQRAHAALDGRLLDLEEVLAAVDEVADRGVNRQHLEDAGAAEVAGVAAADAAGPFLHDDPLPRRGLQVQHPRLLVREGTVALAVLADLAHYELGHRADQARGDQERLDAEVDQARDGRRGVVRVQRGEDQVPGQRRLHRVLRRLRVTDLADHDDVGVLAEDRAQRVREGDADLRLHRRLIEVVVHHLDRVFDRGDVDLRRRQRLERRVERHRLARAGRTGDEDDPVRALDPVGEERQLVLVEPETGDAAQKDVGIEDAHHHFFAERRRQRGDAQLDLFPLMIGLDATVLGAALLGDVHAAHRLEARGDGQVDELRHALDLVQHAVDAEADHGVLALRLDVDVAGARLVGVLQKKVDGVDDVRVAGLDLRARLQLDVLLEIADEGQAVAAEIALGLRHRGAEAVLLVDDAHDVALGRDDDVDVLLHHLLIAVDGDVVEGIDDGDDQLAVAHRHRDHAVLAREGARDLRLDHLDVELQRVDFVEVQPGVFGAQARQEEVVDARAVAGGVAEVHGHERLERAGLFVAAGALCRAGLLRPPLPLRGGDFAALALVDEAGVEEQIAEVGDGDLACLARGGGGGDGHDECRMQNAKCRISDPFCILHSAFCIQTRTSSKSPFRYSPSGQYNETG